MDGQQFDDLVKRLCTTRLTRGSLFRGLAAGTLAAITGAAVGSGRTARAAAGTCRTLGHPCEGQQDCCAGIEVCQVTGPGNAKRCANDPNCGALNQACCQGNTCQLGLDCNGQICVDPDPDCGAIGQPCCEGEFCDPDAVCNVNQGPDGTCVACGANGEPCCEVPGDGCDGDLICRNDDTCGPPTPGCGNLGQVCCPGNQCTQGQCINGTCQNPPSPPPPVGPSVTVCTSNAQCPAAAPFCNTSTGQCFAIQGLRCKSGETAQQCCNRSVKKGCNRKQQTAHARKNCLKKGKKRCKALLAGIA